MMMAPMQNNRGEEVRFSPWLNWVLGILATLIVAGAVGTLGMWRQVAVQTQQIKDHDRRIEWLETRP